MLYLLKSYLSKGRITYKVGYTNNLTSRLSQYQSHNPGIELLATREGGLIEEFLLHSYFHCQTNIKFIKDEWYIVDDSSRVEKIFHMPLLKLSKFIWKNRESVFISLAQNRYKDSLGLKVYSLLSSKFSKDGEVLDIDKKIDSILNPFTINFEALSDNKDVTPKVIKVLKQFDSYSQFTDKMKVLAISNLSEEELGFILSQVPPEYSNYFHILGKDRISACGYQKSRLDKDVRDRLLISDIMKEQIIKSFIVGNKYLKSSVKSIIQDIYSRNGLNKIAKASDLEQAFEVRDCKLSLNGKREHAFEILKIK